MKWRQRVSLSLSLWSLVICPTLYILKYNVLKVSLNRNIPHSFLTETRYTFNYKKKTSACTLPQIEYHTQLIQLLVPEERQTCQSKRVYPTIAHYFALVPGRSNKHVDRHESILRSRLDYSPLFSTGAGSVQQTCR